MAVAIDDEIFQDAYLAQLKPDSEIVLSRKSAVVKVGQAARLIPSAYRPGSGWCHEGAAFSTAVIRRESSLGEGPRRASLRGAPNIPGLSPRDGRFAMLPVS